MLRLFGFGQGAIYVADPDYEYMHAPNQRTKPFGHLVFTNQYGMRSLKLEPRDDVRLLLLGDSVINGGNPMPHEALATTILESCLEARLGSTVRALNISAGSWGPDNAVAFLCKHGLFGTHAVIAVFSSHDLGDIMTHSPIVGISPSFETHYPRLVLWDTWIRYGWPRLQGLVSKKPKPVESLEIDKFTGQINSGWLELRDMLCHKAHIPLHVGLHKDRAEFLAGQFNEQGRRLMEYLRSIGLTPTFEFGYTVDSYRDAIHLSAKGQADLARVLETVARD